MASISFEPASNIRRPRALGQRAHGNLAAGARWSREDKIAFGLALFVILLFAGGWLKPLVGNGETPVESPLIRFVYYPGYLAGLALAAMSWRDLAASLWRAPLVWLLTAMAFASIHWSIDPSMTERRAIALLLSTIAAAAIALRFGWRGMTMLLATAYGAMSVANFAAGLVAPGYGRMLVLFPGAWDGLFVEKNGLGAFEGLAAVMALAAARLDPSRRKLWIVLGGLGGLLVLLSTSKTSLVALLVGVMGLGFVWLLRRGPIAKVVATWFGLTGACALAAAVVLAPNAALGLLGKDATLTGRTLIWAAVRQRIAERPITGYGYGAVFSDTSGHGPIAWIVKELQFRPTHGHDSFLTLWIEVGGVAVAIWVALLVWTWLQAIHASYARRDADLALPLLAMFTLTCITESQVLAYNNMDWAIFVMLAVRLSAKWTDGAGART